MKKIISVFFVLLFAPSAYSAEVAAPEITYIAPWTSLVDIQLSSTGNDPEGCGQRDLYRIDLVNDSGAQAKLSVILAAFMSGKKSL